MPYLRGYEEGDEAKLTLCGKDRDAWVDVAKPWLERRMSASFAKTDFGGFKMNMAGAVTTDLVVSMLDHHYMHHGPICRCMFADVETFCLEDTLSVLQKIYGPAVTVPDDKVKRCLDKEATRWQTRSPHVVAVVAVELPPSHRAHFVLAELRVHWKVQIHLVVKAGRVALPGTSLVVFEAVGPLDKLVWAVVEPLKGVPFQVVAVPPHCL